MSHCLQVNSFRVQIAHANGVITFSVFDVIKREFSGYFMHSDLLNLECARSMSTAYQAMISSQAKYDIRIVEERNPVEAVHIVGGRPTADAGERFSIHCGVRITISTGYSTDTINLVCGMEQYDPAPAMLQLTQTNAELSAKCDKLSTKCATSDRVVNELQTSLKKLESECQILRTEIDALKKLIPAQQPAQK